MYDFVDEVLRKLIRKIYETFSRYRALAFDELNVLSNVRKLYEELDGISRESYVEIASYYYERESKQTMKDADGFLGYLLTMPSKVMKYSWDAETVRKRDYLTEALLATNGLPTEYDRAMKYWARMNGWFAIDVADAAMAQARQDSGVSLVMWMSEEDDRTCATCWELDGKIFPLKAVPTKPHPNCRCWTVAIR